MIPHLEINEQKIDDINTNIVEIKSKIKENYKYTLSLYQINERKIYDLETKVNELEKIIEIRKKHENKNNISSTTTSTTICHGCEGKGWVCCDKQPYICPICEGKGKINYDVTTPYIWFNGFPYNITISSCIDCQTPRSRLFDK